MRRLWPSSLKGQVLLTIGLALLLAQGLNAALIYRAQAERREMGVLSAAAFRLLIESQGAKAADTLYARPRRILEGSRGFRVEIRPHADVLPSEERDVRAEEELRRILAEQSFATDEILVTHRRVAQERATLDSLSTRRQFVQSLDGSRRVLIAAVHRPGQPTWMVARVLLPSNEREIILALIGQTLFTYLILVGAVALILGRITRPLAALTARLERFAEKRDLAGQLELEGPSDIRRLIFAHNAMEDRIAALIDEKDVMLGAIGHDLKTPLAALRVRIESVEDEAERGKMAATIEDIVRSLDDILSLARVGRSTDPMEPTELSALVGSIVEEYEDMGEDVILGDTQRIVFPLRSTWLRRAVRNLIGNALRYGQQARVSLARQDHIAVIRIDDDGPGIPADRIATMFEPFKRGEPSRNSETGGAGLGLTLARAIAEQHGGSLTIANRLAASGRIEGLTATLRLPLG
ncbi:MAG: two-component sensor histidine kinase [Novosphingobium sp.]|nr:two-component sensor histidine kinase [Novosphingobium sp.]